MGTELRKRLKMGVGMSMGIWEYWCCFENDKGVALGVGIHADEGKE